jgi:DNA-binding NarL/FixJ family response regulator
MTISVLLADDEAMVREGLRLIVDAEDDMRVIAEASDGPTAIERARALVPDVAVLDIRMPGIDGLTVARRLLEDTTWSGRVIMLTTFGQDDYLYAALKAGASGFLLKTSPPRLLPVAIREALSGETMISGELTLRLLDRVTREHPTNAGKAVAHQTLTSREIEVLRLIARGWSNTEIAVHLVVAESTVKTHVVHILDKLGLRDRCQAAVFAYESGLVSPGSQRATGR